MPFLAGIGASATVNAANGGKVYSINNLGTAPIVALNANPARVTLTFHNPGTVDVYVAPTLSYSNQPIGLALGSLGGSFLVYANGGTLTLTGEIQGAWQILGASGANNPFTIMESNIG